MKDEREEKRKHYLEHLEDFDLDQLKIPTNMEEMFEMFPPPKPTPLNEILDLLASKGCHIIPNLRPSPILSDVETDKILAGIYGCDPLDVPMLVRFLLEEIER